MDIDFNFACRDDCLDKMVPSDLRVLVAERDYLKGLAVRAQLGELSNDDVVYCINLQSEIETLRSAQKEG